MATRLMKIFAGNANPELGRLVAEYLHTQLGQIRIGAFSDGETRLQVQESVRGCDVFVIQPTSTPANEHLMQLLIALDALKRASAARVTAVLPYFGYARQDQKDNPRSPISAKLVANLIESAGADRVVSFDMHVGQIQGFFDIPVDHLPAGPVLARHLRSEGLYGDEVVVVSPDVGGVARAKKFADRLDANLVIIAKRRPEPNQVHIMDVIGDVEGKVCVMVDDLIDTAGTICEGAGELMKRGAKSVWACATHAVLSGTAVERIQESTLEKLVVTNTIPIPEEKRCAKVEVLSIAQSLGDAIERIHEDLSVSALYERYWSFD